MEFICAEVAVRRKSSEESTPPADNSDPMADLSSRHWKARELLTLPAPEFARATYLACLGREPTPDEFVRLRDRLLVEHTGRMRLLREFHASPEARGRVEGFWRASVADRIYWSPPAKIPGARSFPV